MTFSHRTRKNHNGFITKHRLLLFIFFQYEFDIIYNWLKHGNFVLEKVKVAQEYEFYKSEQHLLWQWPAHGTSVTQETTLVVWGYAGKRQWQPVAVRFLHEWGHFPLFCKELTDLITVTWCPSTRKIDVHRKLLFLFRTCCKQEKLIFTAQK